VCVVSVFQLRLQARFTRAKLPSTNELLFSCSRGWGRMNIATNSTYAAGRRQLLLIVVSLNSALSNILLVNI
jgi:hypothetical protein